MLLSERIERMACGWALSRFLFSFFSLLDPPHLTRKNLPPIKANFILIDWRFKAINVPAAITILKAAGKRSYPSKVVGLT